MTEQRAPTAAPIVLVPGFWLGAWAWDDVAAALRDAGHDVTAITLPGLDPAHADRSSVTLEDHVRAIVDAVTASDRPVVLAVHSARGVAGYAASDRVPDRIAAMVYVDSAPGRGPIDPDFADDVKLLPPADELAAEENLDGLTEEHLVRMRERAVPEPGGVLRDATTFANDARLDLPNIVICTGFSSDEVKAAMDKHYPWMDGLDEIRAITWVDLPTSHWTMWSRPKELAAIIGEAAETYGRASSKG